MVISILSLSNYGLEFTIISIGTYRQCIHVF